MGIFKRNPKDQAEFDELPIIGAAPSSEKEEKFLREVCEFEFYNLENPNLSVTFPYGNTRKNRTFTFFHGGRYKVPRFIARHLESCATPIWDWRADSAGTGRMIKKSVGSKPRFRMSQVYG